MIAVTGASSGLGREVARQLGGPVLAVARRAERLEALRAETGGRVEALGADMTDAEDCARVAARVLESGCGGIVLNAGVTAYEAFAEGSAEGDARVLEVNVAANLRLVRAVVEGWTNAQRPGRILIVASLAGLVPVPYQAVYAGTKAFMVNFGLSLREELREQGIVVSVFAPGGIATEMTAGADFAKNAKHLAPVEEVAGALIAAYRSGDALVVPGAANKATALAGRLLPRGVMARAAERVFRKS